MPETIKIVVTGRMNSGKSTITKLISDALQGQGLSFEVHDESLSEGWHAMQSMRIEALKNKVVHVVVTTQNTPRF